MIGADELAAAMTAASDLIGGDGTEVRAWLAAKEIDATELSALMLAVGAHFRGEHEHGDFDPGDYPEATLLIIGFVWGWTALERRLSP